MDIGDYYSKSINGFSKNPTLAIPTLAGYIIIYGSAFIIGILVALGLMGTNFLNTAQFSPYAMSYPSPGTLALFGLILLVFSLVVVLINSFMSAATIGMAKNIVKGERPDLNVGLKKGRKYFIKIFLVTIILWIIFAMASMPFIIGLVLDFMNGMFPVLTLIGGLISSIIYVIVAIIFIFAYQSIVVGKKSIIGSLKESIKLIRKNIAEVLIVLVINAIILASIMVVMFFINMFLGLIPIIGTILSMIISIAVYTVVVPYFTLVLTYLYVDLKEMVPLQSEY